MSGTRTIIPIDQQQVMELLRDSLRIEVKTTSEYTGGMNGGSLYTNCLTVQLLLDGEVISEVSL